MYRSCLLLAAQEVGASKKNIRELVKIKSPVFKAVVFKFVDDKKLKLVVCIYKSKKYGNMVIWYGKHGNK